MLEQARDKVRRHIRTHSERSAEDRAAISLLGTFLNPGGRISTDFAANDTWPNHDGTFEFVLNPEVSRRPTKNFLVQIKGTGVYTEKEGIVRYSLKSLAFPAYLYDSVTLDPGILFVVLDPEQRGAQRVFWKYMSVSFLNSIDFDHESVTISFSADEEIRNTDESVAAFCKKLEAIVEHHSCINRLDSHTYTRHDVEGIIAACDTEISESLDRLDIFNDTRDDVSRRILRRLDDLCSAALLLNAMDAGIAVPTLPLAWEHSMLTIGTKYLGTFLKGLQYIGKRIPHEGQSERLMLKYYDFLWQIRKSLNEKYGIRILRNLEKFPLHIDQIDRQYYELAAVAIESVSAARCELRPSRYYVQKKMPFFVGYERYYEITLQLAGAYASKYNRIIAYTKENISTSYSVQVGYVNAPISLWGIGIEMKVVTDWRVSIDPACLNKLGKVLNIPTQISSQYREYKELMSFLTRTGLDFLDLIDFQEIEFSNVIDSIYKDMRAPVYKEVLLMLRARYSRTSDAYGRNVVRYLLLNLREETLESVMPTKFTRRLLCDELFLSSNCVPFERNPFISNLAGSRTSVSSQIKNLMRVAGSDRIDVVLPYLRMKNAIRQTGEIYFEVSSDACVEEIRNYNAQLGPWERKQGYEISVSDGISCIRSYEQTTLFILNALREFSNSGNKGQREYNQKFLRESTLDLADDLKKRAIRDAFVHSRLLLIYGAAGTGKTTLINYISNLMANQHKLFLTKTHTALQNLKRRIENPGRNSDFVSIDSFTKQVNLSEYDIIFVDECSTIDNRTMERFLSKTSTDTFLVLAGDIHQIESIEFGNWFFYAKDIIKTQGANVELLSTWRTRDPDLIDLWNEVRTRADMITEKLVIDGPYSEDIGPNIFERTCDDEVILCLNYDGKFGLNNMNSYFQAANTRGPAVSWAEWTYKIGDPILFNDSKRFDLLYNNLKGRIVDIQKYPGVIFFTVDVEITLTEVACRKDGIVFIEPVENGTRIRFEVYEFDESQGNPDEDLRISSVVPFQLAYAVSIHKAQGLEYDSVKVIIPSSNAEKITHGIFYTAITRAKTSLKIYWSSETMQEVVKGFTVDEPRRKSLEIVKTLLDQS